MILQDVYPHRLKLNVTEPRGIFVYAYKPRSACTAIVLCHWPDNAATPWVVWVYNLHNQSCGHGDYRMNFDDALKAFNERR